MDAPDRVRGPAAAPPSRFRTLPRLTAQRPLADRRAAIARSTQRTARRAFSGVSQITTMCLTDGGKRSTRRCSSEPGTRTRCGLWGRSLLRPPAGQRTPFARSDGRRTTGAGHIPAAGWPCSRCRRCSHSSRRRAARVRRASAPNRKYRVWAISRAHRQGRALRNRFEARARLLPLPDPRRRSQRPLHAQGTRLPLHGEAQLDPHGDRRPRDLQASEPDDRSRVPAEHLGRPSGRRPVVQSSRLTSLMKVLGSPSDLRS